MKVNSTFTLMGKFLHFLTFLEVPRATITIIGETQWSRPSCDITDFDGELLDHLLIGATLVDGWDFQEGPCSSWALQQVMTVSKTSLERIQLLYHLCSRQLGANWPAEIFEHAIK